MEEEKEKVDLEKKSGKKEKKSKKDKKAKKEKDKKDKESKKDKKGRKEEKKVKKSKQEYEECVVELLDLLNKKMDSEDKSLPIENREIMVSVLVTTFNQEDFIEKTLDSIIVQKVNFAIEILVGDDCSSDRTPNILRKYNKRYPGLFRIFIRQKNLGPTRNYYELCMQARGKYIAGCEGDDHWNGENRLQRQIDFLEENPEYVACAGNFSYIDEWENVYADEDINRWERECWYDYRKEFTLKEFKEGKNPSHGATIVHRNFYQHEDISIIYKAHPFLGDVTIAMLLLAHGKIYRMNENMASYRRKTMTKGNSWNDRKSYMHPGHAYDFLKIDILMEEYAKKRFNIDVEREAVKNSYFISATRYFVQSFSRARWVYLWKMLKITGRKMHYAGIILKAVYFATVPHSVLVMKNINWSEHKELDKTWKDFRRDVAGKDLILYGAGGGCYDVLEQYADFLPVKYVIDRDKEKQGWYLYGYVVKSPNSLKDLNPENTVVLITTGIYFLEMAEELEAKGFFQYYLYQRMERRKWKYKLLDWMQYIKTIWE